MGVPDTELSDWVFLVEAGKGKPRYPAEFLREVESRLWPSPATGKDIKFISLPPAEQSKIYQEWRGKHRATPAQQLAPGMAKGLREPDRNALSHVLSRGSTDAAEMAKHLGENFEAAKKRLTRYKQAGYLSGHQTTDGHPYWMPTEIEYEVGRYLDQQQKTADMENISDWTFLAFHDPRKRKFRHPATGNWVFFDSLPQEEQARYMPQLHLQESQPQSAQPIVEGEPGDGGDMGGGDGGGGGDGDGGGGGDGGGAMAMLEDDETPYSEDGRLSISDESAFMLERGQDNTGEVAFGDVMSMGELEARLGDYLGLDSVAPEGLDFVPFTLERPADLTSPREGPDTDPEGGHLGGEEEPEMGIWSFLKDEEKEAAMDRRMPAVVERPNVGVEELAPEPPPPAQVRRQLQDRMRELGRGLMVAGAKSPRMQMMAIQGALEGLLDQLEALSDQPGREALRRRILLQLRPRVMRF